MKRSLKPVKALAFDVFGTVVDWRGSIVREAEPDLKFEKRFNVNATDFLDLADQFSL